ncbi:ribosomal protein RPL5 [Cardiosporidium cionae]|uniref:Ribosomal protein RPL5 n=1 Tax=Cardiosporidium cionae TaxID=476202 RepID=A0ABQ7J9Y4_9APIC|nr:ribosomal protein RPL5 [Cardiosporidium cionae]|eukprot:KAF8820770.1 ribosomal protein RPL5 [Cardiosporidium cionae]
MVFAKLQKSKAYFSRYQVKLRRRREGKTDYRARSRLIRQQKNKYNAKKYRFVVRITNKKIVCQVIYSTLQGDKILCGAESTELPRYGISVGLTNYSAAYATGLLLTRRLLKKLHMDKSFTGLEDINGEDFNVEENESRRPFKCLLDVGIIRTTTGNRVFGAMKGACDGGIYIPHSTKRFIGYSKTEKDETYDAEAHRNRIFGLHVADYMRYLQENDPEKYNSQFSQYIKNNIDADSIEKLYAEAHKKIRADPTRPTSKKEKIPVVREGNLIKTSKGSYVRMRKLTLDQRKQRVFQKMEIIKQRLLTEES